MHGLTKQVKSGDRAGFFVELYCGELTNGSANVMVHHEFSGSRTDFSPSTKSVLILILCFEGKMDTYFKRAP